MPLTSKQRAALRADAHQLTALVHVGHQGVSPQVRTTLDDALRTHELVKIQFTKTADLDVKQAANDLAQELAAEVVQVIGRTATLYRFNPDIERREGLPPWKR